MCLLNHFVLYLLATAINMFLSFIRFEFLSFENCDSPYHIKCETYFCGSFVRVYSSFPSPRGTPFPSHLFKHILSISGNSYLFGSSIFVRNYVHLKDGKAGWK